ncbi:MAG: DUF1801 domain-containing protein [Roseiflexaceae bacterium]|nr:DUF1801 domain-containing protein [Roseiflexaceae bacterium]
MNKNQAPPANIDAYIAGFPQDIQGILQQIRATIREAAPDAEEAISYNMPTFKQHGYVIFFAAFKKHIGMYGNTTAAIETFRDELAAYTGPKGSLAFPYNKPIPFDLIGRIVQLRVQENIEHAAAKATKK